MEVFAQYFRRLVSSNASAIFSGARDFDQGSYKLLRQELDKVLHEHEQASHIAEAVDTSKEDIFRDFDLATFVRHFYTDVLPQSVLAVAFTRCARQDLRNKAEKLLAEIGLTAFRVLSDVRNGAQNVATLNIVSLVEYYALSDILTSPEQKYDLYWAVGNRFDVLNEDIPTELLAALQLLRLTDPSRHVARALQRAGSKATANQQAAEDILQSVGLDSINESEITNALLFMVFSSLSQYDLSTFVQAVASKLPGQRLTWDLVLQGFDLNGLRLRPADFLRLFNALNQKATEQPQFDIQKLWGGRWQNLQTQTSFLKGYLLSSSKDIAPSKIPNFRSSFSMDELNGLSTELKKQAQAALDSHIASMDAIQAIFEVVLGPDLPPDDQDRMDILHDVYQNHAAVFLLSLSKIGVKPWVQDQEKFVAECFSLFLEKRKPESNFVLSALTTQDSQFTFDLCTLVFQIDPRQTEIIYARAEEFGWTENFLRHWSNPLALDIACMRDKILSDFDLDKYITEAAEGQPNLGMVLCKYLRIKADDEYRVQREQSSPQSIPLSLRTVHTLLEKLEDHLDNRELIKAAQTTCLQTYPRLMNYGAGFDDILKRSSEEKGNKLPEDIDKRMSDLFGRMYRSELSIRDMINEMRGFKTSRDPEQQDLFCCIVHGLFDEYVCYSEYPEDALEKTALLFGSIIKYKLLPPIPREFGLALILEAVREHEAESLMHRFGIEALLQIGDQLMEWPGLCSLLLQTPTLQHPEILQRARDSIQSQQMEANATGANTRDPFAAASGPLDDITKHDLTTRGFRALYAEGPALNAKFGDPDQKVQEKILFVINNLSKDNMSSKLPDFRESLSHEHYQWFASYLVEQRARLEPNNQQMYLDLVSMLNDKGLMSEILRETYVSIVKLMNAEATINSATERGHLKNLGGWLGSLTLAQDKPIKHKNIFFVDLLLEGYESQRLIVVIPFTCKVLAQGVNSMVFKPPNPWLMEIVRVLKELYLFAELKLNLKFEIEVLCKDLKLDFKKIEPARLVRERQQADEEMTNVSALPDGLETFDDLSLNGAMNRGVRERLSAPEIMATLPSLEEVLKYPPTSGSPADQALIKSIIFRAFHQAIQEIIAPVVERSITIASISTAQLISKDYALEPDSEKYRLAARQMVKSLAGSLALVTCKEPLRMSITNYIRRPAQDDLPEHLLPEGAILMCVNDNLDIACSFVEQAAEERAIPEIDHVIEQDLEERRRFQSEGGNRDFLNANVKSWSAWIPEPYKQSVGGLNDAQRAVYEEFDRRVHGMSANHVQSASTDSNGRQLPDVLQDSLAMPNLSTPADQPAMPHQSPMNQPESRALPAMQQPRTNGFADTVPPHERITLLIEDVQKAARESEVKRLKDLERNSSIFQDFRQILIVLTSSTRPAADLLARQIAEKICTIFVMKPPKDILEAEVLAFLLSKLCQLSELIVRDVLRWMTANEDLLMTNSNVVAALVIVGLMDFARVDAAIASAIVNRNQHGVQLLSELMDQTLFTDEPLALRADFANSLINLCAWLKETPDLKPALDIVQKLREHGIPQFVDAALTDKIKAKQDQMRYIFDEWAGLYENLDLTEHTCAAFLKEMHKGQIINGTEDLTDFLRLAIDSAIDCFEREAQSIRGSLNSAFSQIDALAKLIIMLVKFQGENNGAVRLSKAPYLETVLSVVVLIMNHHQVMRGVAFHQRVFHRLISTVLYEYATAHLDETPDHNDLMVAIAKTFKSLQPTWFPCFVYSWTSLIMHRVFVTGMLKPNFDAGTTLYRELIGLSLLYPAELLKTPSLEVVSTDLYRGILKNMLVLHHDYPEFLSANHTYFCSRIPFHIPQLRNLILTSRPLAYQDLPDPMTPGLKIERLDEMKKNAVMASDFSLPLRRDELQNSIDAVLYKSADIDACIKQIRGALEDDSTSLSAMAPPHRVEVSNALIPYIAQDALANGPGRFDPASIHVSLLIKLVGALSYQARYQLFNSMADQIRYPSTLTDYFCKMVLHIWGTGTVSDQQRDFREQISRVVYERLAVARPHPWGITILSLELQQNPSHGFWETLAAEGAVQQRLQQAMRPGH